ncbi:hypothetical protein J6590_071505 [Homalodisca vitripennis]|nr:hypothetical protein J6590_071505 [Homalodisca vitripennis]
MSHFLYESLLLQDTSHTSHFPHESLPSETLPSRVTSLRDTSLTSHPSRVLPSRDTSHTSHFPQIHFPHEPLSTLVTSLTNHFPHESLPTRFTPHTSHFSRVTSLSSYSLCLDVILLCGTRKRIKVVLALAGRHGAATGHFNPEFIQFRATSDHNRGDSTGQRHRRWTSAARVTGLRCQYPRCLHRQDHTNALASFSSGDGSTTTAELDTYHDTSYISSCVFAKV